MARPLAEDAHRDFLRCCEDYRRPKPPETAADWLASLTVDQRGKVVAIADALTAKTFGPTEDAEDALARLDIEFFQTEWAQAHLPPLTPLQLAKISAAGQARMREAARTEVLQTTGQAASALLDLGYPAEELPPSVRQDATVRGEESKAARSLPAEELLVAWVAETRPAPATLKKYRGIFGKINRSLGFDDVCRITPENVRSFKDERLRAGVSPGTVADDVLGAGAVCAWAAKNRLLLTNPFAGLAPRSTRQGPEPRAPFDDNDAALILSAARAETGWLRWLPWLFAFTGARISELIELKRADVRQQDAVWFLDIKPNDTRKGKNATFQRMLPLHPALTDEGFLAYVSALPEGPLFPSITPGPDGSRVSPATTKHGEWLREKVGIKDPQKAPAHSWRHRMEDELRRARVPEEVVDAITGRHNPRNSGAGYGKGYRRMPAEVLKELAKVPSPLPLPPAPRSP